MQPQRAERSPCSISFFAIFSSFWPLADFTLLLSRAYLSLMHACVDLSLVAGAARAAEAAEGGASARSAAGHAAAIAAASVLAIAGSTAVAERAARHRTLTALANAIVAVGAADQADREPPLAVFVGGSSSDARRERYLRRRD